MTPVDKVLIAVILFTTAYLVSALGCHCFQRRPDDHEEEKNRETKR